MWRYARYRRLTCRHISTESTVSATEAKKVEEGGGWRRDLKRFGKYLVVIVPGIIGGVVTSLVMNNKAAKESIESVFPSYIDFVRKNFGFVEENLEEEESIRIRNDTVASSHNVKVTLKYRNGSQVDTMHFENLKGLTLCGELMEMVRERLGETPSAVTSGNQNTGGDYWDVFLKNVDISFDFLDAKESESSETNEENDASHQPPSDPFAAKTLMIRAKEELLASLDTSQKAYSFIDPRSPSLWIRDRLPTMKAIRNKQKQLLFQSLQLPQSADDSIPASALETCKHVLHVQFCNKLEYIHEGFHAYKAATGQDTILHGVCSHYKSRGVYVARMDERRSKQSETDIQMSKEKAKAIERVRELESRVNRLNSELTAGTRPTDDVLEDLRKTKAEIKKLKRTYINTLYFF